MTTYKPERDLPLAVMETKTLKPSVIQHWILNKRNVELDPTAITKYFTRHPDLKDECEKALAGIAPNEKQAVDASLFENGNFREVSSVKDWKLDMQTRSRKGRPLNPEYIEGCISLLRQVCRENLKHPDRLTYRDAQEIFALYTTQCCKCHTVMEKLDREGYGECSKCNARMRNRDTSHFRKILKDFLTSKGIVEAVKIGVGRPRGFGHYKDLDAPEEKTQAMLEYVKMRHYEAYVLDEIMWHKGIRVGAAANSQIENFKVQADGWSKYKVLEKFSEWKTFNLSPELTELIKKVIGNHKEGKIFTVDEVRMATLNREAVRAIIPELDKRVKEPSHLFRHLCAQRLKRKLGSERAAAVMQTTLQSFKESYGGDTAEDVEAWERMNA